MLSLSYADVSVAQARYATFHACRSSEMREKIANIAHDRDQLLVVLCGFVAHGTDLAQSDIDIGFMVGSLTSFSYERITLLAQKYLPISGGGLPCPSCASTSPSVKPPNKKPNNKLLKTP